MRFPEVTGLPRGFVICLVMLMSLSTLTAAVIFYCETSNVSGTPTRATVIGNEVNSTGLMQSASFSSVETWDNDGDGLFEIYMGGAGRNNPKTRGISAYEYVVSNSTWVSFGSGLPGPGSGEYYGGIGLGDVNKDGNVDIVAPIPTMWYSSSTNAVEIWTSNSNDAFTKSHSFSPGKSTNQAIVEDLDSDSNPDIVYTYYGGLTVQFGSGSATSWTESGPTANGYEMDGVAAGDLNHDGLMDLVATPYFNTRKVFMYIQGSSRSWSEVTFKQTTNEAFGIQIADVNKDGNNDVIYGTRGEGIKLWCGNGGGSSGGTSFTWTDNSSGLPMGTGDWAQVELGDVDKDGDLDIIAISSGQDRARIFVNNLPSSWTELFTQSNSYLTVGGNGYGTNFVDFDGDGDLDAVACSWSGGVDAYTIHTQGDAPPPPVNERPTADAGEDIEVMLGEPVNLNGTGSTDPEDAPSGDTNGDILYYDWNVTSYPSGSMIRDSSLLPTENSARPSFTPDRAGRYRLTLRVRDTDGNFSSVEDVLEVMVLKPNDPPVADAGLDRSGHVGETFILNGSASMDIDGTIIEYQWNCTSHELTFTGQGTVNASFKPQTAGSFNITLRVRDDNDTWSLPDMMNVQVSNVGENLPPVANAGPDQEVLVGVVVTLDGSGSMDPDGYIVQWEWTSTSHPEMTLDNINSSSPTFTPEQEGDHIIALRVQDSNDTWSSQDMVIISVEAPYVNRIPVAVAGQDMDVLVGELVTLDGRDSYDEDGYIASYNWTCISHTVTLISSMGPTPSFVPGEAGEYVIALTVSDDQDAWSLEDRVIVNVTEPPMVTTYDISLGPFRFEDGTLVTGGIVSLIQGGSTETAITDDEGKALFEDVMAGSYKCRVQVDGEDPTPLFDIIVEEGGSVSIPGGLPYVHKEVVIPHDDDDDDLQPDDDDDNQPVDDDEGPISIFPVIAIIVLVSVVAAGAGILFYVRHRGHGPQNDEIEERECPKCNAPMEYNSDFNRYRCLVCGGNEE
ncbi:MAG: VCBS repeat-containing protein [Candidatus Thermoplasmatota archaeon]|nr:VCBS repeat-containing protein [Candidatus Thermoplasmatota archaeon]